MGILCHPRRLLLMHNQLIMFQSGVHPRNHHILPMTQSDLYIMSIPFKTSCVFRDQQSTAYKTVGYLMICLQRAIKSRNVVLTVHIPNLLFPSRIRVFVNEFYLVFTNICSMFQVEHHHWKNMQSGIFSFVFLEVGLALNMFHASINSVIKAHLQFRKL